MQMCATARATTAQFSRTLQLPTSVDPQQVTAEYANGVLTVTLKKTPAATAKKIPVKTA